jgi:hypothetical protein
MAGCFRGDGCISRQFTNLVTIPVNQGMKSYGYFDFIKSSGGTRLIEIAIGRCKRYEEDMLQVEITYQGQCTRRGQEIDELSNRTLRAFKAIPTRQAQGEYLSGDGFKLFLKNVFALNAKQQKTQLKVDNARLKRENAANKRDKLEDAVADIRMKKLMTGLDDMNVFGIVNDLLNDDMEALSAAQASEDEITYDVDQKVREGQLKQNLSAGKNAVTDKNNFAKFSEMMSDKFIAAVEKGGSANSEMTTNTNKGIRKQGVDIDLDYNGDGISNGGSGWGTNNNSSIRSSSISKHENPLSDEYYGGGIGSYEFN